MRIEPHVVIIHRIGFAAALAAMTACAAATASAQSYQTRPSITYQSSQPTQRYQ
jgi:hypothetical protein